MVVLAQDEARSLGHPYIGTEHMLLGLVREGEGIAAHVLGALGIGLAEARADVEQRVGRGEPVRTGQMPFTPGAKKSLELALREAQALGHRHLGTEHLLLGVAGADGGVAREILLARGAVVDDVRREVVARL